MEVAGILLSWLDHFSHASNMLIFYFVENFKGNAMIYLLSVDRLCATCSPSFDVLTFISKL